MIAPNVYLWASYVLLTRSNQRSSGPRICVCGSTKKGKITEIDHFFHSSFSPFSGFKKLSSSFMNVCVTQPSLLFERVRFDQLEKFTSLFLSQKRVSILSPTGQIRIGLNSEFFLLILFILSFFFLYIELALSLSETKLSQFSAKSLDTTFHVFKY